MVEKSTLHKKFRIKIEQYSYCLDVYLTEDIYKTASTLVDNITQDEADGYDALFFTREHSRKKGVVQSFIIFNVHRISANSIAHEAMHFITYMLDYHGVRVDLQNDEPLCYLIGYVVGRIFEKITKLGFNILHK